MEIEQQEKVVVHTDVFLKGVVKTLEEIKTTDSEIIQLIQIVVLFIRTSLELADYVMILVKSRPYLDSRYEFAHMLGSLTATEDPEVLKGYDYVNKVAPFGRKYMHLFDRHLEKLEKVYMKEPENDSIYGHVRVFLLFTVMSELYSEIYFIINQNSKELGITPETLETLEKLSVVSRSLVIKMKAENGTEIQNAILEHFEKERDVCGIPFPCYFL